MPDHIVRDFRSFPIYDPSLFSESSLKAVKSHTKEYKQERFQTALAKGVSNQLSASLKASPLRDQNHRREILRIGNSRRVLVLFEDPVNPVVESHPEVGAKSLNLSLNLNDVLQGVRVAFDLSKVPLIPPDPSTLPVRGWLGCYLLL